MIYLQKIYRLFLLFSLSLSVIQVHCKTTDCQTISQNFWLPRSFSSYRSREYIDLQTHELQKNTVHFSFEHMNSFGNDCQRLGSLPWWSGTSTMTIGSNNGKSDLDAYQFGLGLIVLETGSITLQPNVQHVGAEVLWKTRYNLDAPGAYGQVKVPLGAMMISTRVVENHAQLLAAQDPECTLYPLLSARFKTIQEALMANFEHRQPDYQFGRLCAGRNTVIRCGDIEVVAGYNFYVSKEGFFGAGFKLSCPTGNVPQAKFLLEPIFGRAGHWGVGAEFQGSYKVYENEHTKLHFSVNGDILHLLPGRTPHWRSLDLKLNGSGSKYLLLQRYVPVLSTAGATKGQEFRSPDLAITPAINITTVPVSSTIPVEGSVSLALAAQRENWNAGLIVEFWGRAQECLQLDYLSISKFHDKYLNDYAVLGRQISRNYDTGTDLYLCEPKAKINKSADRKTTPGEDTVKGILDARDSKNRIPADYKDALDIQRAQAPQALTGKITTEFGYTWLESNIAPHISIFGGLEFANKRSKFENLWSIGAQGSLSF